MKPKLLMALTSGVVASAVGIGATFALFTDSKSTQGNFTAGTLCLTSDRNDGDTVPGPMFYVTAAQGATPDNLPGIYPTGEWAPGDSHTRTLTVSNPKSCSSMSGWLASVEAVAHPGGFLPMADKLWVEIYTPMNGPEVKVGEGWLSQFLAGPVDLKYPDNSKVPMYLTSNRHMKFKVNYDLSADNTHQGQTLVVDFKVNAEQMSHNP